MLSLTIALSLLACTPGVSDPDDTSDTLDTSDTVDTVDTGPGPTAAATADPVEGTIPFEVVLSGADSQASGAAIASYEWTLPDGSVASGDTVTTSVLAQGTNGFTLTVTDEDGHSDEASVEVEGFCPGFGDAAVVGTMAWGEVSGLAAASVEGVLWAHSDAQGSGAKVYAISTDAQLLGTFELDGIDDYDWEDIARGPGPEEGVSYVYVADTGDNSERRGSVQIYRFEEPSEFQGGLITEVETIELTYPDGARDSESLIVDPLTGDLILIERDRADEGVSGIYVAEAPLSGSIELTHTGTLVFGTDPLPGDVDATAADVSPDGTLAVVRSHDMVFAFARDLDQPLWTAFDNPVCATPEVNESKGEAIAYAWDGSGYYTGGEGNNQPLHWYGLE